MFLLMYNNLYKMELFLYNLQEKIHYRMKQFKKYLIKIHSLNTAVAMMTIMKSKLILNSEELFQFQVMV